MNNELSQIILTKVMRWTQEEDLEYRQYLQTMASYKYDDYQQFSPGMRFIESLAQWLNRFESLEERKIAINFIKEKLVFISNRELNRIVYTLYTDYIKKILIQRIAKDTNQPEYKIAKITNSIEYKKLKRQCLFLGFSDGAKTEIFRRANPELSHEQIYQSYELSSDRANKMQDELEKDLKKILNRKPYHDEAKFKIIFLMDDFTASGKSYIRENEDGSVDGKIKNIHGQLTSNSLNVIDKDNFELNILFYLCTEQAYHHISDLVKKIPKNTPNIYPIYKFSKDIIITESDDIYSLCMNDEYYDKDKLEDEHTKKGGKHVKLGFGKCSLPVILNHNTPNNSLSILWSYIESQKFIGLFPRVARHKE